MNVKIYTVHHTVPQWFWATEVWVPFLVGEAASTPDLPAAIETDFQEPTLTGHSYAEMRCHYWVWKHPPGTEYVGFQHYRRAFISALTAGRFAELRASAETFVRRDPSLTTRWIGGLIEQSDIIVPRRWPALPDLGTDYAGSHSAADWEALLGALPAPDLAAGVDYVHRANMFIMRAELFDEYMAWWDAIMTKLAAATTPPTEGYQSRTFGFMSERLFTMWLALQRRERPELRILELPLMVGNFTAI